MSGRPQGQGDSSLWLVSVFENYGPVNPDHIHRVCGWAAMVEAVRLEIEQCRRHGDEPAKAEAAHLLAWLGHHYRTRDYSLRLTSFHVGRDAIAVQLCAIAGDTA